MKPRSSPVLRSLLALSAAAAAVVLLNQLGARWAMPSAGPPAAPAGRLGWDLAWVAIAGAVAGQAAARLAPAAATAHVAAFFALMLGATVAALSRLGGDWPRWFPFGLLAVLPLQAALGLRAARRRGGTRRG